MGIMIADDTCDCCVGLNKEYSDIFCEECNGTGIVKKKTAYLRSLYNKLLNKGTTKGTTYENT